MLDVSKDPNKSNGSSTMSISSSDVTTCSMIKVIIIIAYYWIIHIYEKTSSISIDHSSCFRKLHWCRIIHWRYSYNYPPS